MGFLCIYSSANISGYIWHYKNKLGRLEIQKQVNMTKLHKIKKCYAKILATIITASFFHAHFG